MRILNLPRAGGKTTRLIEWARSAAWTSGPVPTRVILVPNAVTARYVREIADGVKVVTPSNLSSLRGFDRVEVAIDELDEVVSQLVGFPVVVATRTGLTNEY